MPPHNPAVSAGIQIDLFTVMVIYIGICPLALHYIELLARIGALHTAPNASRVLARLVKDCDEGGVWHPKNLRSRPRSTSLMAYHAFPLCLDAKTLESRQVDVTFRLALIALVILPILPDKSFGPYGVLNPFRIWLMVVLIVGISLASYLTSRFLGARVGSVLGGVMGGLISSTATTVSYARRSRHAPDTAALAAVVIMIASTAVFLRVAFEVSVVAPSMLPHVLPQFGFIAGWMALICVAAFLVVRRDDADVPSAEDPSDLRAAVIFGLLYAAVLVAVAAAKEHFGDRGLYVVAALSGLTDMDAITLSTAQMMQAERVALDTGWRMMLVGALSNIVFKAAVIGIVGHRRLLRYIAVLFTLSLIGGALLLWLWPDAAG